MGRFLSRQVALLTQSINDCREVLLSLNSVV